MRQTRQDLHSHDPSATRRRRPPAEPADRSANPGGGVVGLLPAVLIIALLLAMMLWGVPLPQASAQAGVPTGVGRPIPAVPMR